ncbi:MAG: head fiber protein [Bifidobacterium tsurumiense]|uniref:head fiber protein n=1 Tax=Bifidobacterium tsurumiense TaxID=356829 RepID=UPI002A81D3BC|nr:head fiber protein [Bifidobacterium tsurumiense]MDY4677583.1 head fiber protein [Bifidobacterium tsurumiense]
MVDVIVTDKNGVPQHCLTHANLDLSFGSDENDFQLDDVNVPIEEGSLLWIDGTEYGGQVDSRSVTVDNGVATRSYSGRTWQGMLVRKRLLPDSGQSHLVVSGRIDVVLTSLVKRIGLDSLFTVDENSRTIPSFQFDRFVDAYSGIRKLLSKNGLRLQTMMRGNRPSLGAVPIRQWGDRIDSDLLDFKMQSNGGRVNHLIGLGEGEEENRQIVHKYADRDGNVSDRQSIFGRDEIVEIYDYSSAKKEELGDKTAEKLKDLQSPATITASVDDDTVDMAVDDIVTGADRNTGISMTSTVVKKTVKVEDGFLSVDYEVGEVETKDSLSGGGGGSSASPGTSYAAGDGITISGGVISAEVTSAMLSQVSSTASEANAVASGLSAQVGAAQSAAKNAQDTADSAVSAAAKAQSAADSAQRSADVADGKAVDAASAAVNAQSSADSAGNAAKTAQNTADGKVGSITATSPIVVSRSGDVVNVSALTALTSRAGLMSAADKIKLNGIATGANNYTLPVATTSTLGGVKPDGTTVTVSSTGVLTASPNSASAGFLAANPIGTLYRSTKHVNPGTKYGGTWVERTTKEGYLYERLA